MRHLPTFFAVAYPPTVQLVQVPFLSVLRPSIYMRQFFVIDFIWTKQELESFLSRPLVAAVPSLGIVKENVVLSVVFACASLVVARAPKPKTMIMAMAKVAKCLEIVDSMRIPSFDSMFIDVSIQKESYVGLFRADPN